MNFVLIGCGNMGSAIVRGAVTSGVLKGHDLICIDTDSERANGLAIELGAGGGTKISEPSTEPTCYLMADKPDKIEEVVLALPKLESKDVVVSVAAGVTYDALLAVAGDAKVVRTMPNTPSMVGEGATALFSKTEIPSQVVEIFESIGLVIQLDRESLFDAVTGLSGSGPAYIFVAIEALADGGVQMGLNRQVALQLATQTVMGAAKLAKDSGDHPGQLKDNVASPGGATIAALSVLERGGFRSLLIDAVKASADKSRGMG